MQVALKPKHSSEIILLAVTVTRSTNEPYPYGVAGLMTPKSLAAAAYGCKTCRLHGARKPNSIKRGMDHPNYLHGTETLERKRQRSIKLAELREIENDLIKRGFIKCKRTVGRKPAS